MPRRFSPGGVIAGPPVRVRLEHVGYDADGHRLVSINGGRPERILTAEQVRNTTTPNGA